MKKTTIHDIMKMKAEGQKIPVLTAYSFPVAAILDSAGIPLVMVGDSVGMVEDGFDTTLPVTMEDIIYHTRAVARGAKNALVVSDMPFASYQVGLTEAKYNACRLVKEGRAEAVKLEGGRRYSETIRAIVEMGVPVMGHVGLTPQSVHMMGGFKVQGREKEKEEAIIEDALAVEAAGAFSVVLEGIPAALAATITSELKIPTIGIGAGLSCDGQVLVVNDMLGLTPEPDGFKPKFVKRYAELNKVITSAVTEYILDVREGRFPDEEHSY